MVVYFTIEIRIFRATPFFFIHPVIIIIYKALFTYRVYKKKRNLGIS
jgi:hypothetical protein